MMRKLCKTDWMFSFLMIASVLFAVSCFKDIGEISQEDKILDEKLETLVTLMLKEGLDEKAQQQLFTQIDQFDSEQGERFFCLLRHRSADEEKDNEDELKVQLPMIDEMSHLAYRYSFERDSIPFHRQENEKQELLLSEAWEKIRYKSLGVNLAQEAFALSLSPTHDCPIRDFPRWLPMRNVPRQQWINATGSSRVKNNPDEICDYELSYPKHGDAVAARNFRASMLLQSFGSGLNARDNKSGKTRVILGYGKTLFMYFLYVRLGSLQRNVKLVSLDGQSASSEFPPSPENNEDQEQPSPPCLPQSIECSNDVPAGTPLPHEFNPNLTVVARDTTGLHIIGNEADQYLFTQFYADPNPANLLAVWVQGNWNGFSMGFVIPFGYNKFTPAKQRGANFLPAGGANTRVSDGVQVVNGGFALTCGNRVSNDQLLTDADMIRYPVECVRDVEPNELLPQNLKPELVVLTRRWGLHVIGYEANQYRFCQWYADPNPANLPAIWNEGRWDGASMYFEEPYGYNKFTPAKQQGQDFLPAGDFNTRVSQGAQIINQGFAYTCGQRTSDEQVLSDRDYLPVIQPPVEEPEHQSLYIERSDNQIVMANGERWPYILWWAIPNPNNLTLVWLQGNYDGNYTYFDIPQGRNRFVIAETNTNPRPEQFYPVGSNQAELGSGIRIVGTDFEIDL